MPEDSVIVAVGIGNTRSRWAVFHGRELSEARSEVNAAAPEALGELVDSLRPALVAVASVHRGAAEAIESRLARAEVLHIGRDINPPLRHSLDDASTLGIDRALNAVAAFSLAQSACVVVDAGTAITVDFVDGEGVFHGGAIAPGLTMMLRALHAQTDALPAVRFERPDPARGPFGKDTRHAMCLGALAAAGGLVRQLVERYAEHFGAYPRVIGTGGDAATIFDSDDLVERIIPDLQLIGIQRTVEHHLGPNDREPQ